MEEKKILEKIGDKIKLSGTFRIVKLNDFLKYSKDEILGKKPILIELKKEEATIVNYRNKKFQYFINPFELIERYVRTEK